MASPVHVDTSEKADPHLLAPTDGQTLGEGDSREAASRFVDDLELLRAERLVSNQERENASHRSKSAHRRHEPEPEDAFNTITAAKTVTESKPAQSTTFLGRQWTRLKKFPRVFRYIVYAIPPAAVLLTPILLDIYAFPNIDRPVGGPGGLQLLWFGIWLEIVWCSLWGARIIAAILPGLFGCVAKMIGSSNHKKWKDIGRSMEMPTALFAWMLGLICSYQTIMDNNRSTATGDWSKGMPYIAWIDVVWKIIIALFVLAACNFVEKILIQWIAMSFHERTYSDRISQNKAAVNYLVQLYEFSRQKKPEDQSEWDNINGPGAMSGARTPMKVMQDNARQAWSKVGNAATKMAGDFTGRKLMASDHPQKVVTELLRTSPTSHTLARKLFRTFVRAEETHVTMDDLKLAFVSPEDAENCFGVFDKDLNGDISMEEMELACNEIHLEKKAIAASLKDLDSVIKKLDQVFLFIIFIIAAIVFISIISGSAAAALGTSGTVILGLSWMLQATAQEFLQSIIFVFVKHPYDVGDRVTVYGNTGSRGTGDDYYVVETSLLFTEFKKMEGHIVQAPNSLLNTLFILNQRRSNNLADPIELKLRFGTPSSVIEELKARMLDFVLENKRDYAPRIITEVRTIDEVWSVTINFIFFHKSNFQNELLRLQRHNKFAAELMRQMGELGIEGPRKMEPGGTKDFPFYWASVTQPPQYSERPADSSGFSPAYSASRAGAGAGEAASGSSQRDESPACGTAAFVASPELRRRRAASRAQQNDQGPDFQDVFEDRREQPSNLTRLQSLHEEEDATRSSGIHRIGTTGRVQTSRGLFGRPRSASKPQGAGESIV